MRSHLFFCAVLVVVSVISSVAFAGYGVFVTKGNAGIVSEKSNVAVVRDGNRTVVTISNLLKGEATEIGLVVPVPKAVKKKQVNIGSLEALRRIDAYSSARLVHRKDPNPCEKGLHKRDLKGLGGKGANNAHVPFKVDALKSDLVNGTSNYEIETLTASESKKIGAWLRKAGYKPSKRALSSLSFYARTGWMFVVAKIKLTEPATKPFAMKPLQIAYLDENFKLPLGVGASNSKSMQDFTLYFLSRKGRVLPNGYKTLQLPSSIEVPEYVKSDFDGFYKAMTKEAIRRAKSNVFFLDHAWDAGWCDPCVEKPLSFEELKGFGVFWVKGKKTGSSVRNRKISGADVFISRLSLRSKSSKVKRVLSLDLSSDRNTYQGSYIVKYPFGGDMKCGDLKQYEENFTSRRQIWAKNLAGLTGWEISSIRRKMKLKTPNGPDGTDWIDDLWK